jgi:phosphoenolpyruvate carboxykinase (GTP)
MAPFCGCAMSNYIQDWFSMKSADRENKMPPIFKVNWFRRDENNDFLWPGFADNSRVLKWIFEQCDGLPNFIDTPIGYLPTVDAISCPNTVNQQKMQRLLNIDPNEWKTELSDLKENFFPCFGDDLPPQLLSLHAHFEKAFGFRTNNE